jgi:hypothetical protein
MMVLEGAPFECARRNESGAALLRGVIRRE